MIVAFLPYAVATRAAAEAPAKTRIFGVQLVPRGAVTCFNVLSEGKPSASVYSVQGPARVVIDTAQAGFQMPGRPFRYAGGLVRAFRYGVLPDSVARIVVDVPADTVLGHVSTVQVQPNIFRLSVALGRGEGIGGRQCLEDDAQTAAAISGWGRRLTVAAPKRHVIVIDPGHGGVDPGAVVNSQYLEKLIVLAVGQRLAEVLGQRREFEVVLTRSDDTFVSLDDRVAISRERKGDVFVSLHADSVDDQIHAAAARGAAVYTLSERASDAAARRLAQRENDADLIGGGLSDASREAGVRTILVDLLARETRRESARLSHLLVDTMRGHVPLSRKPRRAAAFHVLKQPETPAVLIELGYMTNPHDLRLMRQREWQDRMANAIAEAIGRFVKERS